jgi:hypothetical protein
MVKKSPDMILLEECFRDIKMKHNIPASLERIQRIIKRNFDIDFTISIVDNDTNQFFGMSIYPSKNQIQMLIDNILNKKASSDVIVELWQKNKSWVLEMDSILIWDSRLNTNPAEMVAVLLHEIGHIVYSNTVPQRINKILRYKMMTASITVRKLIEWPKAQRLVQLVFIEACSSKNYRYVNLNTERVADTFVTKMGYGENLDEFINKLIASQGNSLVNRTDSQLDRDVTAAVNWTFTNIGDLEFRKTGIRVALQAELLKSPSRFVKEVVYDIKKVFFNEDSDQYATAVTEQYLVSEFNTIVKEGLLSIFDKNGKVKKINQSDVDILVVEASKIENEDDKIYVLDLVYDKLNTINAALDMIQNGNKDKVIVSKDTLMAFKSQLEKIRLMALETPIRPKQYGVFMKYPKGYEG